MTKGGKKLLAINLIPTQYNTQIINPCTLLIDCLVFNINNYVFLWKANTHQNVVIIAIG